MKTIRDKEGNFVANVASLPANAEVDLADPEVLKKQMDPNSHREFMNSKKRAARLTAQVEQFVADMITPSKTVANVQTISDEMFSDLMEGGEELWATEHFTPVSRYGAKIQKIRPLFKGEVGVVARPGEASIYLVLEESEDKKLIGRGMDQALQGMTDSTAVDGIALTEEDLRYAFKVWRPKQRRFVVVVATSAMDAVSALDAEDQETATATRLSTDFVECANLAGSGDSGHQLSFTSEGFLTCTCGRKE
jgi:hypothetical protein